MDRGWVSAGLLMVTFHGLPSTNCFVAYDGNGNVTALAEPVTWEWQARYEYTTFGEILKQLGPLGNANQWRFCTKFVRMMPDRTLTGSGIIAPGFAGGSPVTLWGMAPGEIFIDHMLITVLLILLIRMDDLVLIRRSTIWIPA